MKYLGTLLASSIVLAGTGFAPALADDPFLSSVSQQLRYREAYSYRTKMDQRGIEVGVEAIGKDEQRRLFGDKVSDYVTLDVVITNNSPFRLQINDIEIIGGKNGGYIAKDDLHEVVEDIDPGGGGNKDAMRMAILRTSLATKSLQTGIVEPGETVQGVVFARKKYLKKDGELFIRLQNLKRFAYLEYTLPFQVKK